MIYQSYPTQSTCEFENTYFHVITRGGRCAVGRLYVRLWIKSWINRLLKAALRPPPPNVSDTLPQPFWLAKFFGIQRERSRWDTPLSLALGTQLGALLDINTLPAVRVLLGTT